MPKKKKLAQPSCSWPGSQTKERMIAITVYDVPGLRSNKED